MYKLRSWIPVIDCSTHASARRSAREVRPPVVVLGKPRNVGFFLDSSIGCAYSNQLTESLAGCSESRRASSPTTSKEVWVMGGNFQKEFTHVLVERKVKSAGFVHTQRN